MNSKQIGNIGEDFAENYLKKRFWRILSRNYQTRDGEIDIIAYRFGVLVYFEVKSRSNDQYGRPADAVDEEKVQKIKNTAMDFLSLYRVRGKIPVFYPFGIKIMRNIRKERIDVIEIFLSRNKKVQGINHIKDWGTML